MFGEDLTGGRRNGVLWWLLPDGSYASDDMHVWLSLVVVARRKDAGNVRTRDRGVQEWGPLVGAASWQDEGHDRVRFTGMGKNCALWCLPPDGKIILMNGQRALNLYSERTHLYIELSGSSSLVVLREMMA